MRVLVCGSRFWRDWKYINVALDEFHKTTPITVLIEGEARGADLFARNWAHDKGILIEPYPALWNKYHDGAGPIRNQQMIDEGKPEIVIAFHTNLPMSKGTADMVLRAKLAKIPVIHFEGREESKTKK